jgi:hypothetical protein
MPIKTSRDALKRLDTWNSRLPNGNNITKGQQLYRLSEHALECFLVAELFVPLGYRNSIERQCRIAQSESEVYKKDSIIDVLLKPTKVDSDCIIVELKRFNQNLNQSHAIQAARYATKKKTPHCIVTNGRIWKIMRVVNEDGQFRIYTLLQMDSQKPEERQLLHRVLTRCHKDTILGFLECLWNFHQHRGNRIHDVKFQNKDQWMRAFMLHTGSYADDIKILKFIYLKDLVRQVTFSNFSFITFE